MDQFNEQRSAVRERRPWEPPKVKTVGTITEIVRMAKLSGSFEPDGSRKPPGQEPH
jgi:hypothetical protein